MATSTGTQLEQSIRQRIEELKKVCEGVDEHTASRAKCLRVFELQNHALAQKYDPESCIPVSCSYSITGMVK